MLFKQYSMSLIILGFSVFLFSCGDDEPSGGLTLKACIGDLPTVTAGTALQFNSDCSENEKTYLWDFGGVATSTEANPSYIFNVAGTYTITLTVYDGTTSATAERAVTISQAPSNCTATHFNRSVTTSETWKTGETHCIRGFFQIEAGGVLTIEPGVTVKVYKNAGIYVVGTGAALIAEGTQSSPILFTSAEPVPQIGDWIGIQFTESDLGASRMKYCTIEYGGSQVYSSFGEKQGMMYLPRGESVSVDNCVFRKSLSYAVQLGSYAEFTSFTNNTISDAGDYAIVAQTQNVHSIGAGNIINNKGILLEGEWFEKDVTWLKHNCPYYTDGFTVGSAVGMTLTISPGVEFRLLNTTSGIRVGYYGDIGRLIAQGTPTEKIVFTSAAETPGPGAWNNISFGTGTMGVSILDNVIVEYAGGNDTEYAAVSITTNSLQMSNTIIRNIEGMGISLDVGSTRKFLSFTNNTIAAAPTAYAMKMHVAALPTIGEGNTITGKSIYLLGAQMPNVQQILLRNFGIPYIVDGNIVLGSATYPDHTLTIEPGTVLKFTATSGMTIANSNAAIFKAVGTASQPIVFTSAKETGMAQGDWDGIEIYNRVKAGTIMDYCTVEYGGSRYANISVVSVATPGLVTISNCKMDHSLKYGFYSFQSSQTLTNNTYSNNKLGDTSIQ